MEKINGEHWRTFYRFASYKEAHTKALQDIKRGNNLRKVDSDATHDFLQHIQNKRGVWDKKKVKPHRTTQGKWPETMREATRRTDDEEEAALQQDSTQRACDDPLYFSNADFLTQQFGDHSGVSTRQTEGKGNTQF